MRANARARWGTCKSKDGISSPDVSSVRLWPLSCISVRVRVRVRVHVSVRSLASLWIDTSLNHNTSIPPLSARRGCKVPEGLWLVLPKISSCCSKEASSSQERERARKSKRERRRREWHGVHASFMVRLLSLLAQSNITVIILQQYGHPMLSCTW